MDADRLSNRTFILFSLLNRFFHSPEGKLEVMTSPNLYRNMNRNGITRIRPLTFKYLVHVIFPFLNSADNDTCTTHRKFCFHSFVRNHVVASLIDSRQPIIYFFFFRAYRSGKRELEEKEFGNPGWGLRAGVAKE